MLYECPTCQREVSENAHVCPKCGEPGVGAKAKAWYLNVVLPERKTREEELQREYDEQAKQYRERLQIQAEQEERERAQGEAKAKKSYVVWGAVILGCAGLGALFAPVLAFPGAFLGFFIGFVIADKTVGPS